MSTCDCNRRPWAKLSKLKENDQVILDAGFNCRAPGAALIFKDEQGLYFGCRSGRHYLSGQADDGEHLVGIYPL